MCNQKKKTPHFLTWSQFELTNNNLNIFNLFMYYNDRDTETASVGILIPLGEVYGLFKVAMSL